MPDETKTTSKPKAENIIPYSTRRKSKKQLEIMLSDFSGIIVLLDSVSSGSCGLKEGYPPECVK